MGAFEEPHPSSKLKLWMGPGNLGASHEQEIYLRSKIFSYSIINFIFCASVLDKNVLL